MADSNGQRADGSGTAEDKAQRIKTLQGRETVLHDAITELSSRYRRSVEFFNAFLLVMVIPLFVVGIIVDPDPFYISRIPLDPRYETQIREGLRIFLFSLPILYVIIEFLSASQYVFNFTRIRNTLNKTQDDLKQLQVEVRPEIKVTTIRAYQSIHLLQISYILGTFFIAYLSYITQLERLDALTAIYVFGTAAVAYFRTPFGVPNDYDAFDEHEVPRV